MRAKAKEKAMTGRELGEELLAAVHQMKSGKAARETRVEMSMAAGARAKIGLSQSAFAELMGVSVRTLQDWEQGRRQPSGAAQSLITIAAQRPDVFREVLARVSA
jgi:putative transcriptional regulator